MVRSEDLGFEWLGREMGILDNPPRDSVQDSAKPGNGVAGFLEGQRNNPICTAWVSGLDQARDFAGGPAE
jgi:hypothetical protein